MGWGVRVTALAVALVAAAATLSAQRELRRAFAFITDSNGEPVLNLTVEDFVLVEGDGKRLDIVRAARALDLVRVALVVDSSSIEAISSSTAGTFLIDVRKGLQTFLKALPNEYEVGFFTTGRQMRVRVPPTTDRARVLQAAAQFSSDGGGNTLLNSIREIDERFMRQPIDRWPVWVIITADGPEMSRPSPPDDVWERLVHGFGARVATIHAVAVQFSGGALTTEIAQNLTEYSGGRYVPMTVSTGSLPERLQEIAEQIADSDRQMFNKYVIEYNSEYVLPLGDLTVISQRGDLRVRASPVRPF